MAKAAQATLGVGVVIFSFDPEPGTAASRALQVLTVRKGLPKGDLVEARERFADAAVRLAAAAGAELGGRRARGASRLQLVTVDDEPGRGARHVTAWYSGSVPHRPDLEGDWVAAGRGGRLDASDSAALRSALDRLRQETRTLAGAAALLGEVFTGDDLLRLYNALHGGPEGSERTFRRRVQELRDGGVLRPVRESEVAALRLRVPRFRSPAGTGGRPPELLRYSGSGGEDEHLAALRARRAG